jgi:glutamate 5-kinase
VSEIREDVAKASRTVVKIGSSSLTARDGVIDDVRIAALTSALADRVTGGQQVLLVSSGAIAAGMAPLGLAKRPRDLATQQAAASVGQGLLIARYTASFASHGIQTGQVLLTADDLMRRGHYRNAQRTLERLLELKTVPVINENDTVATDEIRFGDNDRLAALVAHVTRADALILLSDVDGLYDGDPRKGGAKRVSHVSGPRDLEGLRVGKTGQGGVGTGGMSTKVESALIATSAGIPTVVTAAGEARQALTGEPTGTYFAPTGSRPRTRLLWLAHAAVARGSLKLDAGAVEAVVNRRASLLPAGIIGVEGEFDTGDPVDLTDENGLAVARGLVNYDAKEIPGLMGRSTRWLSSKLGQEYEREVVHRDDLVILLAFAVPAVAAAAAEAVEDAAARVRERVGDAAEDPGERVLRPAPRVLIGLGRVAHFIAEGRVAVVVAAGVVAAEDALVFAVRDPVVELGEPHDGERVRVALELEQLQDAVAQVGHRVVLAGLLAEGVRVQLGQVRPARQLHQRPLGGIGVLAGQQPGPVTRQLGLAEPLFQAPDDGPQSEDADRHPGDPRGELEQPEQHGPVDRVSGQDVPELVPDDEPQLFLVVQVHQAGGDHDERVVLAERHRVDDRILGDKDVRNLGQVEDVGAIPDQRVDVGELALGHLDGAGEVSQPEGALVEQPEQLAEKHVETAELAQRDQRGAIGRMLVGTGTDAREPDACTIRH